MRIIAVLTFAALIAVLGSQALTSGTASLIKHNEVLANA